MQNEPGHDVQNHSLAKFFKLYTLEAINLMITVYLSIQLKKELSLLYTNKIFSHTRAMCSYKALR